MTLAERDPSDYDIDEWLSIFEQTRCDGVCLSAGGYVAYYPTKIEWQHRSRWLGDHDAFGELVAGCRERGMAILARTDPHAAHRDVYAHHPEWIAVDRDGGRRRHWSAPDTWLTCTTGPYGRELMSSVHAEIAEQYDVDGIFVNRWSGTGTCYCDDCRTDFHRATGGDLAEHTDPADEGYRDYVQWREERLLGLVRTWQAAVSAVRPGVAVIPNGGGGAQAELDTTRLAGEVVGLFADRQARHGVMMPWASGKSAKEYRAVLGAKPVGGIFGVGLEEAYRWKDSVQSPAEVRVWVSDLIAQGARPWFTKFGGHLHDRRWLDVVGDLYRRAAADERYLRASSSLAEVGLVFSQRTARYHGGGEDHLLGWYQALVEARIPFEMVHDCMLDADNLAERKVLILPNVAALSNECCRQLEEFVAGGGSLVATYETSLYDEWGHRRTQPGLGELFGIRADGPSEGPAKNSYLALAPGALSGGFDGADWIINGIHRVPISVTGGDLIESGLRRIPSFPDLPMEELYPRQDGETEPEAVLRRYRSGRVAYLPGDLDRTFAELLNPDHGRLLANVLAWAGADDGPVAVAGPGMVDLALWQGAGFVALHLVNLTNPMMIKGAFRELYPIGPLQVTLRVPSQAGGRLLVRLLHAGRQPEFRVRDGKIIFEVGQVVDHEIAVLEWS
ncbi:MAG: beta-galactosidase trimerization domain-containing protein [Microlunatus sp.]|nr:beta-galactosidase trimerization domain-containing protein [Microlunatus sp.]